MLRSGFKEILERKLVINNSSVSAILFAIVLLILTPLVEASSSNNFELKGFKWKHGYENAISAIENSGGLFRAYMLEHPTEWRDKRSVELYSISELTYTQWFFKRCDYYRPRILHPRFALYGIGGVTAINWSIGGLPLDYIYHSPFKFQPEAETIDRGPNTCKTAGGQANPNDRNRFFRIAPIDYSDFTWFYFQGSTSPENIEQAIPIFSKQYGPPTIERFTSRTSDSSIDNFIAEWLLGDGTRIQLIKHADLIPIPPWRRNTHQVICDRGGGRRAQMERSLSRELNLHRDELSLVTEVLRADDRLRSSCRVGVRWGGAGEVLVMSPTIGGIDDRLKEKRKSDF